MGSLMGKILVVSGANAPSIQNGIDNANSSKKNFSGDLSVEVLWLSNIMSLKVYKLTRK